MTTFLVLLAFVIVTSGIIILVMVAGIYWLKAERNLRRYEMSNLAVTLGVDFDPTRRSAEELDLPSTELYRITGPCFISNMLRHEAGGQRIQIFDANCSKIYSRARYGDHHNITLIAIEAAGLGLADFALIRKDFYYMIDPKGAEEGLRLEGCKDLTDLFYLGCDDPQAMEDLFTGQLVRRFVGLLDCNVELQSGWLFLYKEGGLLKHQEVMPRVESGLVFLDELMGAVPRVAGKALEYEES